MATRRFNHSYIHCSGDRCEFKNDCIHFLAWQEAVELRLKNIQIQNRCEDVTQGYVRVTIEKPIKKTY